MSKMYVRHKVADFNNWKKVYDDMHSHRQEFGCTGEFVFRQNEDPNDVLIITDWSNKDQAMKYGQSPILKEAMKNAGVLSAPEINITD